ncbi:glycosyltransferase family 39 protein [Cellulomonas sp. HZM]|uniref:glycosyltransferase family 39 protein n=1 Tax=Cellulomonas sp. HZM TaxID=1454010 RepID=UPI00068FB5FD|nr:glycosyltransferase family 39 protein [Cellulomonas sp. HZM]
MSGAAPAHGRLRTGVLAPVAGLVAAVVVALGSWVPSIWTDEAATVSASTRSWSDLRRMIGDLDAVHAAYYALMHPWIALAGQSELALRVPSALAVGVAVAGVVVLARPVGDAFALGCAAAVVLLPRTAWAGIEARSFALATAAGVWATVLLVEAIRRRRVAWWAGYAVLVAVAVTLNLYLVLLVLAHAVTAVTWPGVATRGRLRDAGPWLVAAAVGGVVASPVVLTTLGQSGQLGESQRSVVELARNVVVNQWFLGETPTTYSRPGTQAAAGPGGVQAWQVCGVALAVVALALAAWGVLRVVRSRDDEHARQVVAWALPWAVLPTLVVVAYALVRHAYAPRYLTFCAPAVAVLVVLGVRALRAEPVRWVAGALLVGLALPVVVSQRTENAKSGSDWRAVSEVVHDVSRPGDAVYFSPRVPPATDVVTLTTRGAAVAYPDGFQGLVDLTLLRTPAEAGDLAGISRTLQAAVPDLSRFDRVVVLRRHDYPSEAAARDDASLEGAGLRETTAWSGSLDEVLVFER